MVSGRLRGERLHFLSEDEILRMHEATLKVLSLTGIKSFSDRILKVFMEAGAEVDLESKIIKIPEYIVKECLENAPGQFTLCGRNPEHDIVLEDKRIYFGLGGTPTPYIRDLETGEFRRPTKKDFADATRLGDALPNLSFIMAIAGAFDVPYAVEYQHEFEALFNNTEKPIIYAAPGADIAKDVLAMAVTIAGSEKELRNRPILSLYAEPPPPLMFMNTDENIIEFAKAGIPVTLGPAAMAGSTAPVTIAGASVMSNAANLAAISLIELINPGTPVIYACWPAVIDPRTGRLAYAAPEFAFGSSVINSQMAHYYGLPCFGFAGPPDSNTPDAQAGSEATMIALINALSGVNLMHDCGYIAGGSAGSMEMAVICNEICGMVFRIARGVDVNDETLAVDVIKDVGPAGHFLSHKHTLRFLEKGEIFIPKLFNRVSWEAWLRAGRKKIHEVAKEVVKKILNEHYPEPLPKDVQQELAKIVKQAEKRIEK